MNQLHAVQTLEQIMVDVMSVLPTTLVCVVWDDWLQWGDIARLDTAYCSHEKRYSFLLVLRCDELVRHEKSLQSAAFWNWIIKRDVKVSNISHGSSQVDPGALEKYAQRHEKVITHLVYSRARAFAELASHCKHLTHLTCNACELLLRKFLQNNPQLRDIRLHNIYDDRADFFENIALPHLTQMRITVPEVSLTCLSAVLAMPSRLLQLDICGMSWDMRRVAAQLPHLRSLGLQINETFLAFDIPDFVSHCPDIVNLKLYECDHLMDSTVLGVVQNLKKLRSLDLNFEMRCVLTDQGLDHIATHCKDTLEVFSIRVRANTGTFSAAALESLRIKCGKLHTFRCVGWWYHLLAPFHALTVLVIGDLVCCTSGMLDEIAETCPMIEYVEFECGHGISPSADLRKMCQKCPKLHTIVLNNEPEPMEQFRDQIASIPQLQVCDSDKCYRIEVMDLPI